MFTKDLWSRSVPSEPNVIIKWFPALYLGGRGLKSRPRDWLPWLGLLWFFSVPPGKCQDSTKEFSQNAFQFIIYLAPFIWRCVVLITLNVSLNKLQMNWMPSDLKAFYVCSSLVREKYYMVLWILISKFKMICGVMVHLVMMFHLHGLLNT
jgi:hypothetical protein